MLLTINDFSKNVMAQNRMESCWRKSEKEGDGIEKQSDGRGNVSSLHFQAGKPTNSLHLNSGVSFWEKAERQRQTEKSKCKHLRRGGATQLFENKNDSAFLTKN